MVEPGFDGSSRVFISDEAVPRFFEAAFLREILNDVSLALDLGRPVFLLGPIGGGKSALAAEVARMLGSRYGVAWLGGRRNLDLDAVIAACRQGFSPDAWADLSARAVRPGDNLLVVDPAEDIPPRFIEQMIAVSNGSPDLLPSHRLLLVGRAALADVIESGRVRNNWGLPLVLSVPSWPAAVAAPFLRQRLRSTGFGDPDLLSDAAIATLAGEAGGNPGRLLDLAGRLLQPDKGMAPERIDLSAEPATTPTIIDLEPVASSADEPATILFAEPELPPVQAPIPPPQAGRLIPLPATRRRLRQLALPVAVVMAAILLVWSLDQPPPPPLPPPVVVAAAAALPPPAPMPDPAPVVVPAPVPVPVAAPASATATAPVPVEAPPPAPAVPVESLIARGDTLLAGGDFAAARLFYLQAVRAGSARAATAVARTYDPLALDRLGVVGGHGEPDKAREWYRKAVDLGDPAAAEPLRRLSSP